MAVVFAAPRSAGLDIEAKHVLTSVTRFDIG